MKRVVTTAEELGAALKEHADEIEIRGELAGPVGGGAMAVLGVAATGAAVAIAKAAGNADALNELRAYREVARSGSCVVLSRK